MNADLFIILTLFLPLVGGLTTFLLGKRYAAISGVFLSFICSLFITLSGNDFAWAFEWLPDYSLAVLVDRPAAIIISLVLFISLLVHIFSLEYMHDDKGVNKYFAKLGFFTFSMIGLLLADHLLLLFVFWELVGLSSYLLIGFWYAKEGIPASARMAFMVNRVADVLLLIGILILNQDGSIQISTITGTWMFLPSLLVALGAFGKSAQLPFSGWLTKAMVGPTPVSALIHAATMVAAGVYLLFRVHPFLNGQVLIFIAIIGAATALYGGLSALFQHDIKKVLAYSTISQLGYMTLGIGVGGAEASIFHLFTHAFFKAGLFLGAGAIIHYMHAAAASDAQDMRIMGGFRTRLPWTYRTFLLCALALAGLPFFSGFMSKEGIVLAAWEWANQQGTWAYLIADVALITAFLTALYVGRMILLVFFGEARQKLSIQFVERFNLKLPLAVLAIGSLWFWFDWNPLAHESWLIAFWDESETVHAGSLILTFLSIVLVGTGGLLSYGLFKPNSTYALNYANRQKHFTAALNGFYLIRIYEKIGITLSRVAALLHRFDRKVVDGVVHFVGVSIVVFSKSMALVDRFVVDGPVNGVADLSSFIGKRFAGLSSRDIQTQLAWLLVGLLLILSWILFF